MKLKEAVLKKKKAFQHIEKNGAFPKGYSSSETEGQIAEAQKAISDYTIDCQRNINTFAGVAFVSFRTEKMKKNLLKHFKLSRYQRFKLLFGDLFGKDKKQGLVFFNSRILINEASEPGDVYWTNLGLSDAERYLRQAFSNFLSLGAIGVCAVLIYYMAGEEQDLSKTSNDLETKAVTKALAIAILVTNKILSFLIPLIVK